MQTNSSRPTGLYTPPESSDVSPRSVATGSLHLSLNNSSPHLPLNSTFAHDSPKLSTNSPSIAARNADPSLGLSPNMNLEGNQLQNGSRSLLLPDNVRHSPSLSPGNAYQRSPFSEASGFSWTDGGHNNGSVRSLHSGLYADTDGGFSSFSIGGSDIGSSGANSVAGDLDREEVESESPPHNSEDEDGRIGSARGGRGPLSTSSWESVGSPSSNSEAAGRRVLR